MFSSRARRRPGDVFADVRERRIDEAARGARSSNPRDGFVQRRNGECVRQNPAMDEERHEQRVLLAMSLVRQAIERWPERADTAEGVHSCWIDWGGKEPLWTVTEEALIRLEREGVMTRVRTPSGREVWKKA